MDSLPLLHLEGNSWLVPGPTNIGIYADAGEARLIDSGNDKDSGRRILKILGEKAWSLKAIVNTHSNADHIGANNYLQGMTGCEIWATRGESSFIENPYLESSLLWGGFPFKELRSKFFEAKPSRVTRLINPGESTESFTFVPLPGHFVDMIGVLTVDAVFYLGDSLFGENIMEKYKIPFIYDVRAFKESLETLRGIKARYFVPSHGEVCGSIDPLVEANRDRVEKIEASILKALEKPLIFEDLFAEISSQYGIGLDHGQYVLAGSTIRSFLSYFKNEGKAHYGFEGNKMLWSAGGAR